MARKLPLLRTETPLRKRPFMARNHSRLSRKGLLSTLVGIVAILAGAVTAGAATIPSPLRYVRQPGYAVERAGDASERLLDLDVRGLAQLRAVPEKEAVTLQGFPFAPGATGDLVLERFDVASPEGRTLIEGAAGETPTPLSRGVHLQGHREVEPGSPRYLGVARASVADSVIYERDLSVHLTVNLGQAWTTTDPYVATDTRTQLNEVGDWWHANRPKSSYPRTLVQYLSGKPVTGGIAWISVVCANDFSQSGGHWGGAYGVVQVNGAYPASPWDLIASAHEMGHNFGSPHTHCFSPPIDMCYSGESGCYSGPVVNPGPLGGTIMSYCHLLPGGYGNIDL